MQKEISNSVAEDPRNRVGLGVAAIKQSFLDNLAYLQGKFCPMASVHDCYMALSYTVRDRLMHHWQKTAKTYFEKASRTICYLSAEFLIGPQLGNNIMNLGIDQQVRKAMIELGLDLEEILDQEPEPGLGNGGLGRLAACYMDSLATLSIPTIGYGIRYEFGIFNQEIKDGWQVESTDKWLRYGNPWEIPRPEVAFDIKLGGFTESYVDQQGCYRVRWVPAEVVKSIPYDTPVIGYKTTTANFIRLWKAEACEAFDFDSFNMGDYYGAVHNKVSSENITKVLYPNDEPVAGKKLRLKQQYFFVSSSLQDMIRIYQQRGKCLGQFSSKYTVQLNDTHPAIGIAELVRLLVDEHLMDWEQAWRITAKTFCYTNHTLLPEALEKWPLPIFSAILPRHMEIIYEINHRFLDSVAKQFLATVEQIRRLSLIDENDQKYIRMANLACVGSQAINGVSQLHSDLLKKEVLKDFYEIWPEKFSNKTNGVTPRRFLLLINPKLAQLITEKLGESWLKNFEKLQELEKYAEDSAFIDRWAEIKLANKRKLADFIYSNLGVKINPYSLFDIQAKRIHEYKRQLLNLLHVVALYLRIKNRVHSSMTPRTVIFSGKAAPGYYQAKLIIKLINDVAQKINHDPEVNDILKVIFIPNYNVKTAQLVYPAANLSEQISTAGKEASGTGNMKFSINGALTIGTLDGANIEMVNEIGKENFLIFGLTAEQVAERKAQGYHPQEYIQRDAELKAVIELLQTNFFNSNATIFKPLMDSLIYQDEFLVCADFRAYLDAQSHAANLYTDQNLWNRISILNTARMGKFSSDRAILEYCREIWKVSPVMIAD